MANLSDENNGFGPVSEKRGHKAWYAAIVVAFSCLFAVYMERIHVRQSTITQEIVIKDAFQLAALFSCLLLCELMRRCCLYAEERCHVTTRYMGDSKKAFMACMGLQRLGVWIILFIVSTGAAIYDWYYNPNSYFGPQTYVYTLIVYLIVACVLEAKVPSKVEISQLNEQENKYVADGLAWSFYFGYLKLILPNFKQMIADAINPEYHLANQDYRDLLSSEKLFVLIPKNCMCPQKIAEGNPNMKVMGPMPSQRKTRGGVQEREYKNTLYEVTSGERKVYVMLEMATPILAMHEMSLHSDAMFSREDRDEQVVQFYNKLKAILDADVQCKHNVQLVILGDTNEKVEDVIIAAIDNPNVQ